MASVESPAKQFQYMRDRCDLRRLLDREDLEPLIKLPLTSKDIAEFARLTKLSKVRPRILTRGDRRTFCG